MAWQRSALVACISGLEGTHLLGLGRKAVVNAFIDRYVDIVFRVSADSTWFPRLTDSQSQIRKIISALDRYLGTHAAPFRRIRFERCRSTLLKPGDRLTSH
jgi:hypothetical protein